jgi:hypothetical protein
MFHPEVETETTEQFYETYSRAVPRLSVSSYAQDGAGTPLGLAYGSMYNRFQPYYGFGYGYGRDGYYNSYGTYYGYDSYLIGGYTMYIPVNTGERKPRTWTRDTKSSGTNLTTTRTRTNTNESTNNGGYSNSSNITSTRSTTSSTSTNSSSNSGGRRVTKRH